MTVKLPRLLALVPLVCPAAAFALGLGDIRLHSALNEPLNAEIELVAAAPDELSSLRATVASRETFARYGIDRSNFVNNLELKVGKDSAGADVLLVRSRDSVADPFLTFLIEVNWSRGHLLREYTLLLDPPVYLPGGQQQPAAVAAPRAGAGETERSGAVERPAPPPATMQESAPAPTPSVSRPSPSPAATSAGGTYTVRHNDTLWRIASDMRPGSTSDVNRMMMALYRANPEAFAGNINQLRAGAILRIPDEGEFQSITASDAGAEVRRQYAEWRATRGPSAGAGTEEARLRLVTPTQEGTGTGTAPAATAETQQLRSQVQQLEGQLAEQRRLLDVKDAELARLQQQLQQGAPAQPKPAEPEAAQQTPPPAAPETEAAQPATPETQAAQPSTQPAEEPATPAPEAQPSPPPKKPAAAPKPQAPGWLDWAKENWYIPLAALAIIALVVLGLKRRQREPDFSGFGKLADAARAGGPPREARLDREAVTAPVRAPRPAEDSFLVEESGERAQLRQAKAAPEPIRAEKPKAEAPRKTADDTLSSETALNLDQGDPLAEADFHMAYGLYDQAADLVRIAIEREPQRRDLKLKLLEIFFVWGNKDAFLQAARHLAETRAEAAPGEWDKIAIMGRQISPEDPLFAQSGGAGAPATDVDLNLEGGENRVDLDLLGPPEGGPGGAIDLDLGGVLAEDSSAETGESLQLKEGEAGLDFVLDQPHAGADGGGTTREMAARTQETPTIESETYRPDVPTVESPQLRSRDAPTIKEKIDSALFRKEGASPDQTAELALDDLGLELDQLADTGNALSELEETDHPADAPTMLAGMDERSRKLMEQAQGRATTNRAAEPTELTETLQGEDKISPTGTWVLDDKTMAATIALPGANVDDGSSTTARVRALAGVGGDGLGDTARRQRLDTDATAEMTGVSPEEMDLDLDRLEAALKSDTVRQPRKGEDERFSTDVFGTGQHDMSATDLDVDVGEIKRNRDREPTTTERIPAQEMGLPELEPVTMSEVGTKLDLARAYMDMGDPEGARSILEEVLQEGSSTQKQEAQRLIESLPG